MYARIMFVVICKEDDPQPTKRKKEMVTVSDDREQSVGNVGQKNLTIILKAVGMDDLYGDLIDHFRTKMVPYISQLQPVLIVKADNTSPSESFTPPCTTLDEFGQELCNAVANLTLHDIEQELELVLSKQSIYRSFCSE
ncbi:uncharacterized protein LOC135341681 isoform X2 [Halichondria panicea]|uniref:uncharacterized protein LOC135341681 isoform X2 n=1 Tax=Halichondria panicea TaxID=6063 RepID=UPI00312BBE24